MQSEPSQAEQSSDVLPSYASGDYFAHSGRHSEDAAFKAKNFLKLLFDVLQANRFSLNSVADVGCGSGDIARIMRDKLNERGQATVQIRAYDVSPHVQNIRHAGVDYIFGDFCETGDQVDLATLFDVFEHVPDPVSFLKKIALRCRLMGFHIPLENSFNVASRNLFRKKLANPGHLIYLDVVSAINLLTSAGLTVIDYRYTFGFRAPSGHKSLVAKLAYPLREAVARISPWILSRTIGGASLAVIAWTPLGLSRPASEPSGHRPNAFKPSY